MVVRKVALLVCAKWYLKDQNITLLHSENCVFRWLGDIFH